MTGFYMMIILFLVYSFLGWILETVYGTIRNKTFVNRGVLNGPLCAVYGIAAVFITLGTRDLAAHPVYQFFGCMIYATAVEWFAGKALERIQHKRWWDYSGRRGNLDGYICLEYSVIWGILGILSVRFLNPLLYRLAGMLPGLPLKMILWICIGITALDALGSWVVSAHMQEKMPEIDRANTKIDNLTMRFGRWISRNIQKRIEKAYPTLKERKGEQEVSDVFAKGCSLPKLAWLLVIGAFLGDIVETIFVRLTSGVWMSRSSLVWGPFSIVWGLAMVFATVLLYRYKDKPDRVIFWIGTVFGGAYEYFCSVFTEAVFGVVFWDYSKIPFNLGGRINLLYCFFWGIAAVVWIKAIYPFLSRWIEKIPRRTGNILTVFLVLFMAVDMLLSAMALARYDARYQGQPAQTALGEFLDGHFDDEYLMRVYPNLIHRQDAE